MNDNIKNELIQYAREARENAYAPYSGFAVGAALLTTEGKIFNGANVENVSSGLTICAERVTLYNALTAGYYNFSSMAVFAKSDYPVFPCGACRQVLWELARDIILIVPAGKNDFRTIKIAELLPEPFTMEGLSSPTEYFNNAGKKGL